MPRNFEDWITSYVKLTEHTEAPELNRFWAGVGAVAGALRRKVWIDHATFKWYPSFYIIFVAPPEVISKSVSAGVAMGILESVPGIHFGPDALTWQSMVTSFAGASEAFFYGEDQIPMSALTYFSSELGLLVNFEDRALVNLLIDLWDGRNTFRKETKMSGNDLIEAPYISIIACTTPDWIARNLPAAAVGGGFTSRCIFVYAEKKEKLVAHPAKHVPPWFYEHKQKLLQDLEHIAVDLAGPFEFTPEAVEWEEHWYEQLWTVEHEAANYEEKLALQRRHTHLNKLAMVMCASCGDELVITPKHFDSADKFLRVTAADHARVFRNLGKSDQSMQIDHFIEYLKRKGTTPYVEAYASIHTYFPDFRDFEGVLQGAVNSGKLALENRADGMYIKAL